MNKPNHEHSVDNEHTSLALPIAVCLIFAFFAHCAADLDTKAGRTQTLETPVHVDLSAHYVGCRGTPTEVTQCYFDKQR
jgi:hypothetical protein